MEPSKESSQYQRESVEEAVRTVHWGGTVLIGDVRT